MIMTHHDCWITYNTLAALKEQCKLALFIPGSVKMAKTVTVYIDKTNSVLT
jgi:hypothetical protein